MDIFAKIIQFIKLNNMDYTLVVTIFVAVLGWIIAIVLQHRNIRNQHKVQIRYDIYKQLVQAKKDTQDPLNSLGVSIVTPFIIMDSSMIPFEHKFKKKYKDVWVDYTEGECLAEGEQKWNIYVNNIRKAYSEFVGEYIKLMSIFENWESALSKLINARKTLFAEIERLKKNINSQVDFLSSYYIKNGHDWRKWNKDELDKRAKDINYSAGEIGSYINDFLVLAHNELVAKYFNYYRQLRKPLSPEHRVLSLNGLIDNTDYEKVAEMKVNKEKLLSHAQKLLDRGLSPNSKIASDYEAFLKSVIAGICPVCKNPIEVFSVDETEDGFSFHYLCGHNWTGVTVKDQIAVSELIKTRTKRPGFGWLRKITQGHKSSGDPKLKKGVEYYMDVDREKNEYHQVVKNNETKEILHEEHEPLTEHRQKTKK